MLRRLWNEMAVALLGISIGLILVFAIAGVALTAILYGIHSNGYELRIVRTPTATEGGDHE